MFVTRIWLPDTVHIRSVFDAADDDDPSKFYRDILCEKTRFLGLAGGTEG